MSHINHYSSFFHSLGILTKFSEQKVPFGDPLIFTDEYGKTLVVMGGGSYSYEYNLVKGTLPEFKKDVEEWFTHSENWRWVDKKIKPSVGVPLILKVNDHEVILGFFDGTQYVDGKGDKVPNILGYMLSPK
jgi:hypothetical protein